MSDEKKPEETAAKEIAKKETSEKVEKKSDEKSVKSSAEKKSSEENSQEKSFTGSDKKRSRDRGGKFSGKKGGRSRGQKKVDKEFEEEILQIDRVTKVVEGGRRLRFRVSAIVGDRKGRVGFGMGTGNDVVGGMQKAISAAKKNLIKIEIENGTIPHEIRFKHKAARVLFLPGRTGSGLIAGGAVRKICDLSGIENIVAKSLGTNNKIVNAQAAILALKSLRKREV
jgi:small subunit ribosomal protein S5